MVTRIRLCVWRTKPLFIGGLNLTNVSYVNIGDQVKFIDTWKYYQQNLQNLTKKIKDEEKAAVKKSCKKILNKHFYFGNVWASLQQDQILEYLSSGKDVIAYEKIRDSYSLSIMPKDEDFFQKFF